MAQNVVEIKKKDPIYNGVKMGALIRDGVGAGFGGLGALYGYGDADCDETLAFELPDVVDDLVKSGVNGKRVSRAS